MATVVDGALKRIECPKCKRPTTLDGFPVKVHDDGTWSAGERGGECMECPHDCGAKYVIDRGVVRYQL